MAGRDVATTACVVEGGPLECCVTGTDCTGTFGESAGHGTREYVEETWHAMAGWLRVIGGYGVSVAGSLARNDHWRRRGVRARLVGTVQCRLGASAAAIERLVGRAAERRESPAPGTDVRPTTSVGTC